MKMPEVIGLLICFTLCACDSVKNTTMHDEATDLAALAMVRVQLGDGVRQGKPELIVATLDDNVVLMGPNAPSVIGLDNVQLWLENTLAEPFPDVTYEVAEVDLAGDWAFERGTYWAGAGKRLLIYRHQPDAGWKIKYIMWSSNSH